MSQINSKRILFVCPESNIPAGGIKQIYKQVEILTSFGINAFVLHQEVGFHCTWFQNNARILYYPTLYKTYLQENKLKRFLKIITNRSTKKSVLNKIGQDDILVVPEISLEIINQKLSNLKWVIYNQNVFNLPVFNADKHWILKYFESSVLAVVTVSEYSDSFLKYFIKDRPIYRVTHSIDSTMFKYNPNKKKQIAYMPRKLEKQSKLLRSIAALSVDLKEYSFIPISNMSESETSKVLQESLIFLSFSSLEGLGLPPLEAMACGCIVIGYHGQGGKEFFDENFCYPVESEDLLDYIKTLSSVVAEYQQNKEKILKKCELASSYVKENYSQEKEKGSILNAWEKILKLP